MESGSIAIETPHSVTSSELSELLVAATDQFLALASAAIEAHKIWPRARTLRLVLRVTVVPSREVMVVQAIRDAIARGEAEDAEAIEAELVDE